MAGQRQDGAGNRIYAAGGVPRHVHGLGNVIRGLVVPSLLSSYVATSGEPRMGLRGAKAAQAFQDDQAGPAVAPEIGQAQVDALCNAVLRDDLVAARAVTERMVLKGVPVAVLLSKLLAPAASALGNKWLDDDCSFVDVTLGLGTFQVLLRDVCGTAPIDLSRRGTPLQLRTCAMLAEQHTLGNLITGEMFRAAGWAVASDQPTSQTALLNEVRQTAFDAVGISVSSVEFLDDLGPMAAAIKKASLNPNTLVLAGGGALSRASQMPASLGAVDYVVHDLEGVETLIRDLSDRLLHARSLTQIAT